jgi:hypothetical protein
MQRTLTHRVITHSAIHLIGEIDGSPVGSIVFTSPLDNTLGVNKGMFVSYVLNNNKTISITYISSNENFDNNLKNVTSMIQSITQSRILDIGYPVITKVVSPDIIHKSDAGGVKVGLRTEEEVSAAFKTIINNARRYKLAATIKGKRCPFARDDKTR